MSNLSASGAEFLTCIIIFTVICSLALMMRFWAAKLSRRKLFADDAFITFSFANTIALSGVAIWAINNGLGKPLGELSTYEKQVQAKLVLTSGICWLLATVFVKFSVLWLYNRIFTTKEFKHWCYILMALNICYGIAFFVVYQTNCQPISQLWDPVPGGWCRDPSISDYATIAVNFALDVAIVILPMPTLWRLQMPHRNKIVVTVMFSIGFVTIGVMIWRIVVTVQTRSNPDWTIALSKIGLISLLEVWLGTIVACMPTLAPLFNAYLKPILGRISTLRSRSAKSKSGSEHIRLESFGNNHPQGTYRELHESQEAISRDFVHQGGHDMNPVITTECAFDPANEPPVARDAQDKIHVRRQIDSKNW